MTVGHLTLTDPNLALEVRNLVALAFTPEQDVEEAYKLLIKSSFYEENEAVLTPILNYFEDTWLGRLDRRGRRRAPLFRPDLWNCFTATVEGLPRTNNGLEGWHNTLNALLMSDHPTIWKLIRSLKSEEKLIRLHIEHYIAKKEVPTQLPKYAKLTERLASLCSDYVKEDWDDTLHFLSGVASNFTF